MKRRYDNEIDNRSLGKWRVGFGVSTFRLEQQHHHQLVQNFQANEFPFYPLYFIRIRDRGGDEWHGRGEEARETRGGGIEWYSSSGCTSRRKQPDEESERG